MKKQILGLVIVVSMCFILFGCRGGEQGTADTRARENIAGEKNKKVSAEITKTGFQTWTTSTGTVYAHGAIEIKNTGTVAIDIGDISISFIGADHSILGTTSAFLPIPNIIQPGEVAYAGNSVILYAGESGILEELEDPVQVVDIEANINFKKTDKVSQLLDVQDLEIVEVKHSGPKVLGKIRNTSEENVENINIIVAMFDENDNLLGVYKRQLVDGPLAPDKKMEFETDYPSIKAHGFLGKVNKLTGKAYNLKFSW